MGRCAGGRRLLVLLRLLRVVRLCRVWRAGSVRWAQLARCAALAWLRAHSARVCVVRCRAKAVVAVGVAGRLVEVVGLVGVVRWRLTSCHLGSRLSKGWATCCSPCMLLLLI